MTPGALPPLPPKGDRSDLRGFLDDLPKVPCAVRPAFGLCTVCFRINVAVARRCPVYAHHHAGALTESGSTYVPSFIPSAPTPAAAVAGAAVEEDEPVIEFFRPGTVPGTPAGAGAEDVYDVAEVEVVEEPLPAPPPRPKPKLKLKLKPKVAVVARPKPKLKLEPKVAVVARPTVKVAAPPPSPPIASAPPGPSLPAPRVTFESVDEHLALPESALAPLPKAPPPLPPSRPAAPAEPAAPPTPADPTTVRRKLLAKPRPRPLPAPPLAEPSTPSAPPGPEMHGERTGAPAPKPKAPGPVNDEVGVSYDELFNALKTKDPPKGGSGGKG